jgi:hypothetical protein
VATGLRTSALPPYREATYATIAVLLRQQPLSADAAAALLADVCSHAPAAALRSVLMLAAHALECQQALCQKLPEDAAASLIAMCGAAEAAVALQREGFVVDGLINALVVACCEAHGVSEADSVLQTLMADADLSCCAQSAVERVLGMLQDGQGELGWVVRALEARYPQQTDTAIHKMLANASVGADRTRAAAVVHAALLGTVHVPLNAESGLTAAAALTAAQPSLREAAVRQLGEATSGHGVPEATHSFVHSALVERALDEDGSVALSAVEQPAFAGGRSGVVAVCRVLHACAQCMYGTEGGGRTPLDTKNGSMPSWSTKAARKVAKAALCALAAAISTRRFDPGDSPQSEATSTHVRVSELRLAIAVALPFALSKQRAVAAAVMEALRNLPEAYVLSSAFAEAANMSCGRASVKKGKRQKSNQRSSSSVDRSKRDEANSRGSHASAEVHQIVDPLPAEEVAKALQLGLAQAAAADASDTEQYVRELLELYRAAAPASRGRHFIALVLLSLLQTEGVDCSVHCSLEVAEVMLRSYEKSTLEHGLPFDGKFPESTGLGHRGEVLVCSAL